MASGLVLLELMSMCKPVAVSIIMCCLLPNENRSNGVQQEQIHICYGSR